MSPPVSPELDYRRYLRLDMMPHILCPGCGHGIVLKSILRAVHRLGLRQEEVVFVSGIGCSSRIVGYIDFCTLHTTHGRPLTFATGIKLARPDLHVIVVTGDGDGLAIGGNHLIHAARRNIDLTCLLLDNAVYGMTGGQGAPTAPEGARSSISPTGTVEPAFDACRLALGAGATFVARGLTAAPLELDDLIVRAIQHRGFSFVEILSDCPEYFGRYNDLGRGPEMLQAQRSHVAWVGEALAAKRFVPGLATDEPGHAGPGLISPGILHEETRPEYTDQLARQATTMGSPRRREPGEATSVPARHHPRAGSGDNGTTAELTGSVRDGDAKTTGPRGPTSGGAGSAVASDESRGVAQRVTAAGEVRIRIAGAGGQGIVLAGLLLAEAAVVAGRNATHAQAYGPESRGGASKAEVIIADGDIDYPSIDQADVFLALTQEAHDRYVTRLVPSALVVVDEPAVRPRPGAVACHALPLTAVAVRTLGTPVGANLVALGALVGLSAVVPVPAAEQVIASRSPGGHPGRALAAFRAGLALTSPSR